MGELGSTSTAKVWLPTVDDSDHKSTICIQIMTRTGLSRCHDWTATNGGPQIMEPLEPGPDLRGAGTYKEFQDL